MNENVKVGLFAALAAAITGAIVGLWPEGTGVVRHVFTDTEFIWVLSDGVPDIEVLAGEEQRTDRHLFVLARGEPIVLEGMWEPEQVIGWTVAPDPRAPVRELHVLQETAPTLLASLLVSNVYEAQPFGVRVGIPDAIVEEMVWKSPKGKRYHRWPCQYLRREQSYYEQIPISEAIERGLTPCIRFEDER
jgi:hypothetical protein